MLRSRTRTCPACGADAAVAAVFCGLCGVLVNTPAIRDPLLSLMMGHWWVAFLAFMGVSWVANRWASSDSSSTGKQYLGLGLYVVAEAVIFTPLLFIASSIDANIIPTAGLITAVIFGGLSGCVFLTGADFSFMKGALTIASFGVLGLILCSFLFGFDLGTWFSAGMVILMSGFILYDTSNVLHHYRTHQHVAASLALFASVATLLWYVISLLIDLSGD